MYNQTAAATSDNDERTWAMFCHLSALLGVLTQIPFGNIIGPLVVWLLKRDRYPLVNDQGKESLNFQITIVVLLVLLIVAVGGTLIAVFAVVGHDEPPLGFIAVCFGVLAVVGITFYDLISVIKAAFQVNKGIAYRYTIAIRFIK